jgi:anaerobic selenocysteine-containing dehydrogenase
MAEEIETPGDGQIRAMVTIAGNPVLSVPNGERLARALAGLEFMVSVDLYVNETTRHASIILPPTWAFEKPHFDAVLHGLAVRNTVKYSEPVLAAPPDTKDDWEILYELAMRLGGFRTGLSILDRALAFAWRRGKRLDPDRVIDLALRFGPYRLSLKKVRRHPHGIDLGPLQPRGARKRVRTPEGKVELAPPLVVDDVARVARWVDGAHPSSLLLIGRRHLRTNNSWMHNCRSLAKGPDRATLLMHPDDARRHGLADGAGVRVTSRTGALGARLEVTDAIMPGVVSLPHGFGHAPAAATLKVAGALGGPNVNAVTDDAYLEPLSGTAVLNGVPVTVSASGERS